MKAEAQMPENNHRHHSVVVKALDYLAQNQHLQPGLSELSAEVGLSESHFQRVFSEWVGVSPKLFLQYLTKENAKALLANNSVFEAAVESGLSGGGRLHDLFIRHECVTPGEYKLAGEGLTILYGAGISPFGRCFVATTQRGICKLGFFDSAEQYDDMVLELKQQWSRASVCENQQESKDLVERIFAERGAAKSAARRKGDESSVSIKVLLRGTPFRLQVWEALLKIPPGKVVSYQQVANAIGRPGASRAVAGAIASNEIGFLVPCHRVIRESGLLSGFRWGPGRKAALLGIELSSKADV